MVSVVYDARGYVYPSCQAEARLCWLHIVYSARRVVDAADQEREGTCAKKILLCGGGGDTNLYHLHI